MGQRLNIEIKENGQLLANAYYHGGAYTRRALKLTQTILDNVKTINYGNNNILTAIKLLETTGAGLNEEEREYAFKYISDVLDFNEYFDGLITVSIKGMNTTREAEEHRVTINLDTKSVDFDVVSIYSKDEYLNEYYYAEEDFKYEDLPIYKIDFKHIPFEIFEQIKVLIFELIDMQNYCIRVNVNEDVYIFIE